MNFLTLLVSTTGLLSCFSLHANVMWPMLMIKGTVALFSPIIIPACFLAEWYILYKMLSLNKHDSFWLTFITNAVSATLGSVITLFLDLIAQDLQLTAWLNPLMGVGKYFHPTLIGFIILVGFSTLINCIVEYIVARMYLRNTAISNSLILKAEIAANMASGAITILALWLIFLAKIF